MKPLIALYFFILATIQLGLLLGMSHYYRASNVLKPSIYWLASLVFNVVALVLFGLGVIFIEDVSKPGFSFTIANLLFFMATISQGLFCRSLNRGISKGIKSSAIVSGIVFIFFFEILRVHSSFEMRTFFIVSLIVGLLFWQLYELFLTRRLQDSPQLTYLQYATAIEIFFALARLIILGISVAAIKQVDQIPQVLIFCTIAQLVTNTISYVAIGGYWAEKIASSNAKVALENDVIKKLLIEREDLISHLSKANKTAVTGALSASIAHELNQPIAAIQLNTQFFQEKLSSTELDHQAIKEIAKSIEHDNARIANIVSTLRGIFKEDQIEATAIGIDHLIQSLIPILTPQARDHGITVNTNLNSQQLVAINAGEFQQVILNLVNNSIDALASLDIKEKIVSIASHDDASYVEISISDNGQGVAQDLIPNLFELMKSNKSAGMGLGLWLSKHIVERHQGKITYQTSTDGGAEFVIRIPLELT
jgi:signal transduction histidine kinase